MAWEEGRNWKSPRNFEASVTMEKDLAAETDQADEKFLSLRHVLYVLSIINAHRHLASPGKATTDGTFSAMSVTNSSGLWQREEEKRALQITQSTMAVKDGHTHTGFPLRTVTQRRKAD